MVAFRRKKQESSQRRPLADASSKANAMAILPINKSLVKQVEATSGKCSSVTVKPFVADQHNDQKSIRSHLAPPGNVHCHVSASRSSRASSIFRPVKTHVGPWQLGDYVGKGGTCHVRMVRHVRTGAIAVAKIISKTTAEKIRARSLANLNQRVEAGDSQFAAETALPVGLEREIVILRLLRHPNIVRLFDVWENSNEIYLIMEKIEGGELFQHLSRSGRLRESEAIFLFRQLVEALLYCHRMQIYHRDLKPENILVEKSTKTIKVIDFGMAAYQPDGDLLKTPCGSPHYAAPELLEGRAYDGGKVDVWSLMVVLFIMLTGEPPFNYGPNVPDDARLKDLYVRIRACKIQVPSHLSMEAKDLFQKTFIKDPAQRMDIFELWTHPLLHKYDKIHGWQGQDMSSTIERALKADDWLPLTPDTIDRQTFRNLRTLWHDVDENTLLYKLCNADMNAEKHFYYALIQYRDQRLSSLDYNPDRVGIFASSCDYHHVVGAHRRSYKRRSTHSETGSQFSVFQAEHFKSRHSFFEDVPLDYHNDPFTNLSAISRSRLECHANHAIAGKVVHRGSEIVASHRSSENALRTQRSYSDLIGTITRPRSANQLPVASGRLREQSRNSLRITSWLVNRSPIFVAKQTARHKRNVSFDHRRRQSAPSRFKVLHGQLFQAAAHESSRTGESVDSVDADVNMFMQSRRAADIEHAARQVSNELGAACHKAFFSTTPSRTSDKSSVSGPAALFNDTPPTSLLSSFLANTPRDASVDRKFLNRPLPPTPRHARALLQSEHMVETPGTYTEREIAQIRAKLAKRYEVDGAHNRIYFQEIIKQLDSLSNINNRESYDTETRPLSGQRLTSSQDLTFLQSIPEEGRFSDSDELQLPNVSTRQARGFARQSSDSLLAARVNKAGRTIRVVPPYSPPATPTPLAPLRVRKSLVAATTTDRSTSSTVVAKHALGEHRDASRANMLQASGRVRQTQGQDKENCKGSSEESLKRAWWRLGSINKQPDSKRAASSGSEWEDFDDRISRRNQRAAETSQAALMAPAPPKYHIPTADDHAFIKSRFYQQKLRSHPQEYIKTSHYLLDDSLGTTSDAGFLKGLFRKKRKVSYGIDRSRSSSHVGLIAAPEDPSPTAPGWSKPADLADRNFLDRLLRIKPECKVLVMSHTRKASRVILYRVLQQESSSGIVNICQDGKNRNAFVGQLAKDNKWSLKPVAFAIEFFSIMRDGKQSSLTAVRFTQTHGSGSSLRRLVELLCQHLENSHLHTDGKETKEICKMIQTGRVG